MDYYHAKTHQSKHYPDGTAVVVAETNNPPGLYSLAKDYLGAQRPGDSRIAMIRIFNRDQLHDMRPLTQDEIVDFKIKNQ